MTAGTQWITAADMANSAFKATNSGITVQPAALEALVVAGFSNPDTAGTTRAFTVTAVNSYGNVIPGFTGTVQFSSSDSRAVLPAAYTFTAADAGKHSFAASFVTVGNQWITATDTWTSSLKGTESNIVVQPAAAQTIKVTGFPSPDTAGTSGSLIVTAYDAYGNLATGYTGTIHFSSSDSRATLPASYAFTAANAGTHTFAATLVTAGSQSITATDAANSSITGSQTITVRGAAARSLAVTGFPNPDTAGTSGSLTVTARDAYGNPAFGYSGTVQFSSSDGRATLPANYTFSASAPATHTFAIRLMTAGTQWITAADTANSAFKATDSGITVQPAALVALTVAGFPNPDTAGTTGTFTVAAVNSYGNVIPGFTGTVQFSSSDSRAVLPAAYTFTAANAGKHSFAASFVTVGNQWITATDTWTSSLKGTESNIVVQPAAAQTI